MAIGASASPGSMGRFAPTNGGEMVSVPIGH